MDRFDFGLHAGQINGLGYLPSKRLGYKVRHGSGGLGEARSPGAGLGAAAQEKPRGHGPRGRVRGGCVQHESGVAHACARLGWRCTRAGVGWRCTRVCVCEGWSCTRPRVHGGSRCTRGSARATFARGGGCAHATRVAHVCCAHAHGARLHASTRVCTHWCGGGMLCTCGCS